ncbi:Uncoordinated protein 58 [Aphelenchoides bicaudatus]|nr:Uncoordinated protein 58 [Aphelenchoides bicaudatus]
MSVSNASLKPQTKKITQVMKIAIPHIGLYLLLFGYLICGAWAFRLLEYQAERAFAHQRLNKIEDVYRQISNALGEECKSLDEDQLYESLSRHVQHLCVLTVLSLRLSTFMEGKPFRLSPVSNDYRIIMPSKWDSTSSVLYALSILVTTTGFGLAPMTVGGKLLTIAYGFVGIPLMFLAAVDLGRFLSEVVLKIYAKAEQAQKKLLHLCGCPKKAVISQVETKALKVLTPIKRRSLTRTKKSKKKENEPPNKKRLPLSVNASILLLFCMFGGIVYRAAGGNQKNFIGAFFVTFNLVANLTMSEMPTDISRVLTLFYITIFVTFGLAILAMCAELAAVELKWIFIKIHYFGRKINWKRKSAAAAKKEEQMDFELKELLKIITQIRVKHPEKQEITSVDILKVVFKQLHLMHESFSFNSYLTFNMFLQQNRRDTLAFQPQSIEELKFADDVMDGDTTSQHLKEDEEEKVETTVTAASNGLDFSYASCDV